MLMVGVPSRLTFALAVFEWWAAGPHPWPPLGTPQQGR